MPAEHFLWRERYRPRTITDTILPDDLKQTFQQFVDQGNVPDLILAGTSGIGKTTIAMAMLEELGCDYIVINGSLNGNIDTLRNEIMQFASAISFTGGRKYVILDEADYLNPNSTQPALRNFMEEYSANCGFIFTCNDATRIIPPLHSRCTVVRFKFDQKTRIQLAVKFLKRVEYILQQEDVAYDKNALVAVINKHMPDWRRVLNELQRYSISGSIDSGILVDYSQISMSTLMGYLKERNFTEMRKWVAENMDSDVNSIFRSIYDAAEKYVEKASIPALVLIIGKYQYQAAFVSDAEINLAACLTELMMELQFI